MKAAMPKREAKKGEKMRDKNGLDMTPGSISEGQRKKLFAMMGEANFEHDDLKASLGFGLSELSSSETSQLFTGLKDQSKLNEIIVEIKAQHEKAVKNEKPIGTVKPEPKDMKTDEKKAEEFFRNEANKQEKEDREDEEIEKQKPVVKETTPTTPVTHSSELSVQIGDLQVSESMIAELKKIPKLLNEVFLNVMQSGTDYDVIQGTERRTLLKPGAELLRMFFNLEAGDVEIEKRIEDFENCKFFYLIKIPFSKNGKVIGYGVGSCNNDETRYSTRWVAENKIPVGIDKATLRREERKSKFGSGKYMAYLLPTTMDEKATQANTILKMAKKRAFIDGILSITGASRIFTQDVEDFTPGE
jgi:hypothetical protein